MSPRIYKLTKGVLSISGGYILRRYPPEYPSMTQNPSHNLSVSFRSCSALVEAALSAARFFERTPPKHGVEPRDCLYRPRAPQRVGVLGSVRYRVWLVWACMQGRNWPQATGAILCVNPSCTYRANNSKAITRSLAPIYSPSNVNGNGNSNGNGNGDSNGNSNG